MFRCLWKIAGCLLLASGLTGCCLLCPSHCSAVGYGGSYGACVTPAGCPECATGIYGAQVDPVQRARAMRLQKMRRQQAYGYGGRSSRSRHPRQAMAGGYDAGFGMDPYGYDEALDYGFDDGMFLDDGFGMEMMDEGGMPSSTPCNCQNNGFSNQFVEGDWTEGEWVEEAVSPTPTLNTTPTPAPLSTEPQAMPAEQPVPDPIPVTQDQYYYPLPAPGGAPTLESQTQTSSGGSPIQPVLWVPQGL